MRVLRVRRGFTTNSSGGNEWVPGSTTSTTPGRAGTSTSGHYRHRHDGGVGDGAVGDGGAASHTSGTVGAPPPRSTARDNATVVGVLGGVVLTAFVTGSVVRALAKKRRQAAEEAERAEGGDGEPRDGAR